MLTLTLATLETNQCATQCRLFKHLSVKPDPERPAFINVFEDQKLIQTYEMFGRPDQWQAFIKGVWNYGNDRLNCLIAVEARRNGESPPNS